MRVCQASGPAKEGASPRPAVAAATVAYSHAGGGATILLLPPVSLALHYTNNTSPDKP